ncbi:MAG TPA: HAD family phosphatase [Aquabacterium sp.]|nr:HAD family phosphatase [Aquabacterium sp.]
MTEAIVFDFGGVLFNWQPAVLLQMLLPHRIQSADQAAAWTERVFQSFVPGADWSEFDRGVLSAGETCQRIATRTGLPAEEIQLVMEAIPRHLAPIQPTVDWLQRLAQQGVPLYFLSNMPRPYAEHLLAHHPFLKTFQAGVFSCDVQQVKPDAAIFQTAAQRLGLDVSRTVFIDDHPRNVETARALGWRAVQFDSAPGCEGALRERGWLPTPQLR